jgi:hypothetical protein
MYRDLIDLENEYNRACNNLSAARDNRFPLGSKWIVKHNASGAEALVEVFSSGHSRFRPCCVRVRYLNSDKDFVRDINYKNFIRRVDGGAE